jgi:hypothetical protein
LGVGDGGEIMGAARAEYGVDANGARFFTALRMTKAKGFFLPLLGMTAERFFATLRMTGAGWVLVLLVRAAAERAIILGPGATLVWEVELFVWLWNLDFGPWTLYN